MSPTDVEILIISYNTRDILRECLRSVERWSPDPARAAVRVAVLDNASVDGSADMVAAEFPRVRLVRSAENLGFGKANNLLAQTSTAEHLLLLNSDTVLVEDLVTPLLDVLDTDARAAVAGPRLEFPSGQLQYSSQAFPRLRYELARTVRGSRVDRLLRPVFSVRREIARVQQEEQAADRQPRATDFLWATCWLLRRADAEATGLFDPRYPIYDEDVDVCRRLRRAGRTVLYVPGVRLVHLGGSSSDGLKAKSRLEHAARERYYALHHGAPARLAYVALRTLASWPPVRRAARIVAP